MAGLEVAALVPAIVSATVSLYQVYRDWRKRREDRRSDGKNVDLQMLLHTNSSRIQKEYNSDLRRLGEIFKKGDDIVLHMLKDILIEVQAIRITQLTGRRHDDISRLTHPNHDSISRNSKSARDNTITALSQLYQRLAQSSPIRSPLALPSTTRISRNCNCPGQLTWVPNTTYNYLVSLKCEVCRWGARMKLNGLKYVTKDGQTLDERFALDRFHYRQGPPLDNANLYKCFLCDKVFHGKNTFFSYKEPQVEMSKHLREHTYEELVGSSTYSPREHPQNYKKPPSTLSYVGEVLSHEILHD